MEDINKIKGLLNGNSVALSILDDISSKFTRNRLCQIKPIVLAIFFFILFPFVVYLSCFLDALAIAEQNVLISFSSFFMFLAFGLALHAFEYKFSAIDLTQELKYLNKCLKEAADIVEYNIYIDRSSRFIINDEGKIQFINNCSDGSKYCILSYFVLDEYGNTRKITTHEVR